MKEDFGSSICLNHGVAFYVVSITALLLFLEIKD